MANTYSLDLELTSSQYAYIADGDQTGLDITGDFTYEMWIKLEQLPSTAGASFLLINSSPEDVDFELIGDINDLTDYKDAGDVISCRVYQEAV